MGPRQKISWESLASMPWSLGTSTDTEGSASFMPGEVESLPTMRPRKEAAEGAVSRKFAASLRTDGRCRVVKDAFIFTGPPKRPACSGKGNWAVRGCGVDSRAELREGGQEEGHIIAHTRECCRACSNTRQGLQGIHKSTPGEKLPASECLLHTEARRGQSNFTR